MKISNSKVIGDIINECTLLKKIDSPFVVKYLQHFSDNENVFLIMEYAEKNSLKEVIEVCLFFFDFYLI